MIIPTKKASLAYNRLQEQIIIIDFSSAKQFHQVNEVGARIWELCDGKTFHLEMTKILAAEYEIDESALANDILYFLEELKANDLLNY